MCQALCYVFNDIFSFNPCKNSEIVAIIDSMLPTGNKNLEMVSNLANVALLRRRAAVQI